MGVSVTLDIHPQQIDEAEWVEVYDDTLKLLREHRHGLLGLGHRFVNDVRIDVLSNSIERRRDDGRDEWCIVGDRCSLKVGEVQALCRDLVVYRADQDDVREDILWSIDAKGRGVARVLGNETRGMPYHLPTLAAALVVESRFPMSAIVGGDIDREQVEHARSLAESVLDRSLTLPVRTEPQALIMRLEQRYEGFDLVQAFDRLYLDRPHRKPAVLLGSFDRELGKRWLLHKLTGKRAGSLEALNVMIAWLDATRDLEGLCTLVCLDDEGPLYEPLELVNALADTWVGLPRIATEFLETSSVVKNETPPCCSNSLAALFDMQVPGRYLKTRRPLDAVKAALAEVFGNLSRRLFDVFRERTTSLAAYLDSSREGVMSSVLGAETVNGSLDTLLTLEAISELSREQVEEVHSLTYSMCRLQEDLERRAPDAAALLFTDSVDAGRKALVLMLAQNGPRLTEDAWDDLLGEEDVEVLRFLLSLLLARDTIRHISVFRRAMFENPVLRRFVVQASRDEAAMADAEARHRSEITTGF